MFKKKKLTNDTAALHSTTHSYDDSYDAKMDAMKMAMWEHKQKEEAKKLRQSQSLGNFGNAPGGGGGGGLKANYWGILPTDEISTADTAKRSEYKIISIKEFGNLCFVACQHTKKQEWTVFADKAGVFRSNDRHTGVHMLGEPLNDWKVAAALFPDLDSQEFVDYEKPYDETVIGVDMGTGLQYGTVHVDLNATSTNSPKLNINYSSTVSIKDPEDIGITNVYKMKPGDIFPLNDISV